MAVIGHRIIPIILAFMVILCYLLPLSSAEIEKSDTYLSRQYQPENTVYNGFKEYPLLFKPFTSGITSDYPKQAQIFSVSGASGFGASPFSTHFHTLMPLPEITKNTPFEQHLIRYALNLSVNEGISPIHIVEYNLSIHPNPTEDDEYEVGFSLGTENVSLERQRGSKSFRFDSEGNVTALHEMTFTLKPAGEVILESPFTVYRNPAMHITSVHEDSVPIFIYDVNLGYYLHKRPFNRGDFYEPAWIYYGINRKGELITEWVWASGDQGTYPLRDDLDRVSVNRIIVHLSESNQSSLSKDDIQFDAIENESKEVLREIIAQCTCFTTPKQREEQKLSGSYVEVIFTSRTNVSFALMENPESDDLVERQIDGFLIAFNGPFGEMIYPYEYYSETDSVLWGMWYSKRNLSYLKDLSEQALLEQ